MSDSKIFVPLRCLGFVSNHLPLKVVYTKNKKELMIVTCLGKWFNIYNSHLRLSSVGKLHTSEITALEVDDEHIYTTSEANIYAWRHDGELKYTYKFKEPKKAIHILLAFGYYLIAVDIESGVTIWDIEEELIYLEMPFSNEDFRITTVMHPITLTNKLLFGSNQGTLQLWNINSRKLIYKFKGWNSAVTCIEQTTAKDIVAIGLYSGRIILHDLRADQTLLKFQQEHSVTSISFRTDGYEIMATGGVNGEITFWNLIEKRVAFQLSAHHASVTGLEIVDLPHDSLPSEPVVVTSSADNTLKMWIFDKQHGRARLHIIREGHSANLNYIKFHGSTGQNILSAGDDSSLRVFNTKNEMRNRSFRNATYKWNPIILFTSSKHALDSIIAIHSDLLVGTKWSYHKFKMEDLKFKPKRINRKEMLYAASIFLSHCGTYVFIGYSDGYLDRFNVETGSTVETYGNPKAHNGPIRGVVSDRLNQVVVTGSTDNIIKFWTFNDQSVRSIKVIPIGESVNFFRICHEKLAVALEDFTVLLINIDINNDIVRSFEGHTAKITDATFSPDSTWLLTSCMDCLIRTWDTSSENLVDQFKTDRPCISIDMSPTGKLLATAHIDHFGIFIWNLVSPLTKKPVDLTIEPKAVSLDTMLTKIENVDLKHDDEK